MRKIDNWDEVDSTLKRLAELEVGIAKINGDMTVRINELKEEAKSKADPLQVERDALEKQITIFCEVNKHEFMDKRSKQFNFGEVGYRVSKSVTIPKDRGKIDTLVKTLKALGLNECIAYEEKPDRDKLCELDDASFAKLGIKRKIEDNFRIVPNIEKVTSE